MSHYDFRLSTSYYIQVEDGLSTIQVDATKTLLYLNASGTITNLTINLSENPNNGFSITITSTEEVTTCIIEDFNEVEIVTLSPLEALKRYEFIYVSEVSNWIYLSP